jgi:hypothetical protein
MASGGNLMRYGPKVAPKIKVPPLTGRQLSMDNIMKSAATGQITPVFASVQKYKPRAVRCNLLGKTLLSGRGLLREILPLV